MYLREEGDDGLHSQDLNYGGPPDAVLDFVLHNGQRDEYPVAWTLPVAEVRRALEHFRQDQRIPPFIAWHDNNEA